MNLCNLQTIKSLLARHGFRFSKSLGQNFLTAAWVPEEIAASAGLDTDTAVLEIGPGIGCLTVELARIANRVVAVELDTALLPVLAETLAGTSNTEVIHGDILKIDLGILAKTHFAGLRPVVCANLPYNITTPALTRLIDSGLFAQITVMIQREVARRVTAPAGSADYGAFSLYIAYHTEPTLCFDVPPDCFIPQPKVHSAVVTLRMRTRPPVDTDKDALFRIIKAAFAQRRKTLVNCLTTALPSASKEALTSIVESLGHDARIRGETLDLQDFAGLTDALLEARFIQQGST
ncbi:MAG: 16S rRNA (adenine(1518)-N(6)/adenine(1519)-N(6))-dimethyltransferase RsmA [Oscillospiraceae bacterium]|nr:16S rRNA (adenine(1518)-N(6)/adenine(1519)-N(6))-dimethyltransferase RsmA [Oscillospiraceae bacterium]